MKTKDKVIHESNYNLQKSKDEEQFVRFMNKVQMGKIKQLKK